MISTGSMAPCLLGYHRQVVCPDCAYAFSRGTRYDIDDSILAKGGGNAGELGFAQEQTTVCPNCGFDHIDMSFVPRNEGDQLLVQKHFYQLRNPRRWEVVVFRHPEDAGQAYVKRVVGLPAEEVQLIGGDVVIDGELQRKPLAVQVSMRVGVYDNDFAPLDEEWQPRWHPLTADSGWVPDGNAFEHRSSQSRGVAPDDIDWLTYRHWLRSGGRHRTSVPLKEWPRDAPPPVIVSATLAPALEFDAANQQLTCTGVLEDSMVAKLRQVSEDPGFQQAVRDLAEQSHLGMITDVYGYNHPQAAEMPFPVHDLMFEATVHRQSGTGRFSIRMDDGWRWFDTVIDFKQQTIGLYTDQSPEPLRSTALPPRAMTGPIRIVMSLFDRQVLVAVNDEELFPPVRYTAIDRPRELPREPVMLGAADVDVRVEHLRLFRDVYYTPKQEGLPTDRVRVGPEELFVLGDNSPVSVDSRVWNSATIPIRLLIGKPFVVHLPSTQERVEIGSSVYHIRIPDFSRVRYIR